MIVKPKIRGFICTTAHPAGCREQVRRQIEVARSRARIEGPKKVLVIGASSGTFTDAGRMQEWVGSLRDGSWAVVNCFHWPLTECPEEVSRIIEEWIGREFRG